ncbi:uncharacterized protein MONBRDRAFT_21916 [Monosiga brevicollis MX1]|uniref:Uncharacterized protein n=1 Tax=Monosiga brevicollis TaxID=81824 RepID=A9UNZ9_MONBE|nr:uncharacterized protein MONBRDRAFT_21916 [Monosiga brevicollis MX1]EDQ92787.1 predicted protein [Monosiga brevicollis MX1]|eukprot:XP_001742549.1 hypothetical protein [Monosiga brevicollis MX1]
MASQLPASQVDEGQAASKRPKIECLGTDAEQHALAVATTSPGSRPSPSNRLHGDAHPRDTGFTPDQQLADPHVSKTHETAERPSSANEHAAQSMLRTGGQDTVDDEGDAGHGEEPNDNVNEPAEEEDDEQEENEDQDRYVIRGGRSVRLRKCACCGQFKRGHVCTHKFGTCRICREKQLQSDDANFLDAKLPKTSRRRRSGRPKLHGLSSVIMLNSLASERVAQQARTASIVAPSPGKLLEAAQGAANEITTKDLQELLEMPALTFFVIMLSWKNCRETSFISSLWQKRGKTEFSSGTKMLQKRLRFTEVEMDLHGNVANNDDEQVSAPPFFLSFLVSHFTIEDLSGLVNHSRRRKFRKSISQARHVLPVELIPKMGQANQLFAQGHLKEAQKLCEEIISVTPACVEPLITLGMIYRERRDWAKVIYYKLAELHNCRDADEFDWLEYVIFKCSGLGDVYLQDGNVNEALRMYDRAVKQDPDNPLIHKRLADIFWNKKKFLKCARMHLKFLELQEKPDVKDIFVGRGRLNPLLNDKLAEARTLVKEYSQLLAQWLLGAYEEDDKRKLVKLLVDLFDHLEAWAQVESTIETYARYCQFKPPSTQAQRIRHARPAAGSLYVACGPKTTATPLPGLGESTTTKLVLPPIPGFESVELASASQSDPGSTNLGSAEVDESLSEESLCLATRLLSTGAPLSKVAAATRPHWQAVELAARQCLSEALQQGNPAAEIQPVAVGSDSLEMPRLLPFFRVRLVKARLALGQAKATLRAAPKQDVPVIRLLEARCLFHYGLLTRCQQMLSELLTIIPNWSPAMDLMIMCKGGRGDFFNLSQDLSSSEHPLSPQTLAKQKKLQATLLEIGHVTVGRTQATLSPANLVPQLERLHAMHQANRFTEVAAIGRDLLAHYAIHHDMSIRDAFAPAQTRRIRGTLVGHQGSEWLTYEHTVGLVPSVKRQLEMSNNIIFDATALTPDEWFQCVVRTVEAHLYLMAELDSMLLVLRTLGQASQISTEHKAVYKCLEVFVQEATGDQATAYAECRTLLGMVKNCHRGWNALYHNAFRTAIHNEQVAWVHRFFGRQAEAQPTLGAPCVALGNHALMSSSLHIAMSNFIKAHVNLHAATPIGLFGCMVAVTRRVMQRTCYERHKVFAGVSFR